MLIVGIVVCCKAAVTTGAVVGAVHTVYRAVAKRRPGQLSWDGAEALQAFAFGTAVGTMAAAPYLMLTEKGISLLTVAEAVGITGIGFAPVYFIGTSSQTAQCLSSRLPCTLGSAVGLTVAAVSTWSLAAPTHFPVAVISGVKEIMMAVGPGIISYLFFNFVNRLALTELYMLYDAVMPRDRNAPEVDSLMALIRFCQIWGNVTSVALLYAALNGSYTQPINLLIFHTSVPDIVVCNVLFLGLFHHMQALNNSPEEKLLHRASWIGFIPATFFAVGSPVPHLVFAAVFLASYYPYWREMENIEMQALNPVQPADPAVPGMPASAATPATPATPAQPAEPALPRLVHNHNLTIDE